MYTSSVDLEYRNERYVQNLIGKPKWNRLFWRHECQWEKSIKMDLGKVGYVGVERINLAEGTYE
jgi:hypothetical protein